MAASPEFAWQNGRIVPWAEAQVHVFSPAVKYGVGVFEGIRGYWNPRANEMFVFRLKEHLDRLAFSMRVMRFDDPPSFQVLEEATLATLRANAFRQNVHIRLSVYLDGEGEQGATGPVGVSCTAVAREEPKRLKEGVTAGVVSWRRPEDASMPMRVKAHANYHNGRLATLEARANGFGAAVILNARGKVAEAPGACLFLIKDGVAITPSVTSDILESITRETVIELAREAGLAVHERTIDRHEVYAADEAFWCGSGYEIQPILSIDRLALGQGTPGGITRSLQKAYFDAVEGRTEAHSTWRTSVWRNQ